MSTPDTDDPAFRLQAALLGFHGARRRFHDETTRTNTHAETLIIPLTEALWWACSVDEGFERIDGEGYKLARAGYGHLAEKMQALRYVRNRCGHQRALAIEQKGLAPPWTPPITVGVMFRWRPAEELPAADKQHHDHGKDKYQQWLASRPAGEVLDEVAGWFAAASNRADGALARAHEQYLAELMAQMVQRPRAGE